MSKQLNTSYNWDFIPIRVLFACFGILFAITLLSAIILASSRVYANNSAVDDVAIIVPTACSMGGVVDTAHSATLQGGTYSAASGSDYQNGIGKTTLTTFCNDYNGFSIYAIGFTNNQEGTNTLVGTDIPTNTIATKVYESTDTASNWSMRVTKVNDSTVAYNPANMNITNSFDSWHVVPSTYAKVAEYHAQTGSSATDAEGGLGAKVETTYASYISTTQPADTYTGQVKYVMVHPYSLVAGTYTIAYNANGGSGTMTSETNIPNYDEHTLAASTFTAPSGYQFAGWCTVQDQTQTPQTTCSGTSYADEGTVLPSTFDSNTVVNLYAYWEEIPKIYMQDLDSSSVATLLPNIGDTATVYDSRDEQSYMIGKLADGNIWMLDNLALDLYNTSVLNNLSSTNTNVDPNNESVILTSLKSGNRSAGNQYATAGLTAWGSSNSYSVPMANLANQEIPASYSTSSDPMKDTVIANNWKMGGYYNYCAASAGSYCYGDGTSSGTSSGNATSSICPKGWRMPTSNTSGEFATLYNAYSSASPDQYTAFRTAFRLPLSGIFYSGSVNNQGAYGDWWSGTRYTAASMYALYANTTGINPSNGGGRGFGFPLRCVLGS